MRSDFLEQRHRDRQIRSGTSYSRSILADMLVQAYEEGYSDLRLDSSLVPSDDGLSAAYAEFLAGNPEFNSGFYGMPGDDRRIDFRQEAVEPALEVLPTLLGVAGAEIIKVYERYYEEGEEGTGLHDDSDTGSDLVIVRTVFGCAEFTCEGIGKVAFSEDVGPGDTIAFRSDMMHAAGSPIGGPREIEGWAIKLT